MCIILDANAVHDLVKKTVDGKPVLRWLLSKEGAGLVIGGKLTGELTRAGMTDTLRVLSQAGRLHSFNGEAVSTVEQALKRKGDCKSNDHHVVALSLISGCNVVFSRDVNLHRDIKHHRQSRRDVAIYQGAEHAHLLKVCKCSASTTINVDRLLATPTRRGR
jgi:hypothetical protein